MEFVGDNLAVIDLFNGEASSVHVAAQRLVMRARETLFLLWSSGLSAAGHAARTSRDMLFVN